ncbi:metallophosphoesterase [Candidatus Fermentibacteria bacterium]|nr:metallophosphoesterase [Candidatus Fermentibacteria bacterium]
MQLRPRFRSLSFLFPCLFLIARCGPAGDVPCVWTDVERVVAIGDIHGDYHQLVRALQLGQVIDAQNQWIGGRTHLVHTGDVLDRGPDSRKAMDLLISLEEQALKAGGRVHALIGNHEAMILQKDYRYVHPGEVQSHGGQEEFERALSPGGAYGRWICGHNAVIRLNDVLFVHGGLPLDAPPLPLETINAAIRAELAGRASPAMSVNREGALWTRSLARCDPDDLEEKLESALRFHGARAVVAGHTVFKDGIQVRCGGRVILIDVGMSSCYGGPVACLVIEKDRFFARYPGSTKALSVPAHTATP